MLRQAYCQVFFMFMPAWRHLIFSQTNYLLNELSSSYILYIYIILLCLILVYKWVLIKVKNRVFSFSQIRSQSRAYSTGTALNTVQYQEHCIAVQALPSNLTFDVTTISNYVQWISVQVVVIYTVCLTYDVAYKDLKWARFIAYGCWLVTSDVKSDCYSLLHTPS